MRQETLTFVMSITSKSPKYNLAQSVIFTLCAYAQQGYVFGRVGMARR